MEVSSYETNIFSCGPTVYDYAHIGNLRSYIFADQLYRELISKGHNVNWAMNLTDIDDKTIAGTIQRYGDNASINNLKDYTQYFIDEFINDLKALDLPINKIHFLRITDIVPTIILQIRYLLKIGAAYRDIDDSIYFDVQRYRNNFPDYGYLMGKKFTDGIEVSDFVLWKARTTDDAQIFWEDGVLGSGRPGWHIECSAANELAFGGAITDYHTGGVDLRFPHHTNEIAQSNTLYYPRQFVKKWQHNEHLFIDGKKMSKSLGNVYTLRDLEKQGYDGSDFKALVLSTSYRTQQNFTWKALEAVKKGKNRTKKNYEK